MARTWALDPASRLACFRTAATTITDTTSCGSTTTTGVVDTTNHYPDTSSDSPAWTITNTAGTSATTWYANGLDGSLAAQIDGTTITYQLTNLHGDVIATANPTDTAAWSGATICSDEYGNTTTTGTTATNPRYGWLGAKQRPTDGQAGLVLLGVRLYNPVTGLFLQGDPIYGGNENNYGYPVDPINRFDLSGQNGGSPPNRGSQKSRLPIGKGSFPFRPPTKWSGKPVKGGGFVDKRGHKWTWDKLHQDHWDVQVGEGEHVNVTPEGEVRGGGGGDGSGVANVAGGLAGLFALWWGAKLFSPACGPLVLACAIVA